MIGKTLGHYRILERIGAGGMGEVYRAHDQRLERDVAIKILPADALADEAARKRFRKEALALSKLNHPNIQTVHDFDTQDGVDFLVVEFVPGSTLADKLGAGALSEKEIASLGAQIAAALEESHEQGIVHRDLKPGNIKVTPKGVVKVLDFGLAKLLQPFGASATTESFTETHAGAGTLPYMAPEQLRGEPVDARTDIWAAGTVLYEMATGRRPFEARLATALAADIQTKPITPPSQLNPELSPRLEEIILKCLEKDPENRHQSAKELQVDVRRLAAPAAFRPVRPSHFRRWVSRPTAYAAAAGGLALLVASLLLGLNVGGLRGRIFGGVAPGQINSLAVLPLKNLMGDPEQDYFVEGMQEALTAELSKIGALKVISRTSTLRYKETDKPLPQVARELNVEGVIEGSVLREGDQVRVTVQLIHGPSDRHLWAQSFDRELRGILALHSDVAQAIANEIKVKLSPQEQALVARARPVEPEVYELYLRGRYHWNQRTPESLHKALDQFRQAIGRDPDYARAHAGVADTYLTLYDYGLLPAEESTPPAKAAAHKALELDSRLAEAHNSLAHIHLHEWAWREAREGFQRAIELDPGYTLAYHWYALCLTAIGRVKEAVATMEKAHELDPLSVRINADLGMAYLVARQAEQAITQETNTLELEPNSRVAYWIRGMAHEQKGEYDHAIRDFQEALSRAPGNSNYMAALAHAYAVAGRKQQARKLLAQMRTGSEKAPPFFLALVYTGLGETSLALDALERAYHEHSGSVRYLKVEPRLDPLRGDPRFQALLRRMNFPE